MGNKIFKGIDVSYANGRIDWKKAKSEIDFAIIRSTFGSECYPEQIDTEYVNNATQCKKLNIPFGIYHFAYFIDKQTALDEAHFCIKSAFRFKDKIKFIALDVEEDTLRYARSQGVTHNRHSITECAKVFLDTIQKYGYTPVLYTNHNFINNYYDMQTMKKYKIWVAYPNSKTPDYKCDIWQYSWTGKVKGVRGNVDMNFLYDSSLIKSPKTQQTKPINNNEIKVGDTVEVIHAYQYGSTNPFSVYEDCYEVIEVSGDRVVIGINGEVTTAIDIKNIRKKDNVKQYYTVKKGDTLSYIGLMYNKTVDELMKLNPDIKDKNLIYVGQKIRIK